MFNTETDWKKYSKELEAKLKKMSETLDLFENLLNRSTKRIDKLELKNRDYEMKMRHLDADIKKRVVRK
jgi:hypothetical protein